jgi:hypothetical protein
MLLIPSFCYPYPVTYLAQFPSNEEAYENSKLAIKSKAIQYRK